MAANPELQNIVRNMNRAVKKIEGGTMKGLIRSSIVIRRSMENDAPITPVDLGNLRASYFTVTSKGLTQAGGSATFAGPSGGELSSGHQSTIAQGKSELAGIRTGPALMMGFTAFYATFVHEKVDAEFQRPESGAKWFEAALKRNQGKILGIIQQEARIK